MPSIARSVFLLLVAGVAAQDKPLPKPAELAADLSSQTAVTVAWAASHAASFPAKELIAPLRKALHTWRDQEGDEAEVTRLHLLDALLQSGAKVPASELLPLLDGRRAGTAAFVMLLREPKLNERELLELFRACPRTSEHEFLSPSGLRTLALGNILAAQRAPGFAAIVWQQLNLDLHVVASDDGTSVFSRSTQIPIDDRSGTPPGFPCEPTYELVTRLAATQAQWLIAQTGWLTTGRTPVGFRRMFQPDDGRRVFMFEQPEHGLSWVRMMAPMNLQRSDTEQVITFKSRDSFLEEVVAARGKLVEHKRAALRALVAAGAMTADEAAAAAGSTEVHVDDQRANRSEALPDIPPIK
jgi:hypothetical protein